MACVVYCLVPDPEQLDPLVERLKDAGVKTEDIAIVPRRHWPHSDTPPPSPSPFAGPAASLAFWGFSLTPAALWWQLAFRLPEAAAHDRSAIPLEVYEKRLAPSKRK